MVRDLVLVQLLADTEKGDLIGDTDNDTGWDFFKIWCGRTACDLESRVVGLNDLLRETDVLSHEDVEVRVNLQHAHNVFLSV